MGKVITRWHSIASLILTPIAAFGQPSSLSVPSWMVSGFEKAIADPTPGVASAAVRLPFADQVVRKLPPGGRADAVVERMLPLLGDPDIEVRRAVISHFALLPLGVRADAVAEQLLLNLADRDSQVRAAAAWVFGSLPPGHCANKAMDRLELLLSDSDHEVRRAAIRAISACSPDEREGEAIRKLLPLFSDKDSDIRAAAVSSVIALAPREGHVVEALVPLFKDSNDQVREAAVQAIVGLRSNSQAALVIDGLLPLLDDNDFFVREAATTAVSTLPYDDPGNAIKNKLLQLLAANDPYVRGTAFRIVAAMRPSVAFTVSMIDAILLRLRSGDNNDRRIAIDAIAALPRNDRADAVFRALVPILADRSLRAQVVDTLGAILISDRSNLAIDALLQIIHDPDSPVRLNVVRALGGIRWPERTERIKNGLLPLLDDKDATVRSAVVNALATNLRAALSRTEFERLVAHISDEDRDVRIAVIRALPNIAVDDRAAVAIDHLLPVIGDENEILPVRRSAVQTLSAIPLGDRVNLTIDKLLMLLQSRDRRLLSSAADALTVLSKGTAAGAVTDKLLQFIKNGGDVNTRKAALRVLVLIPPGERASAVITNILPLLEDSESENRAVAVQIIASAEASDQTGKIFDRLVPFVDDRETYVQVTAIQALAKEPRASESPALKSRLLSLLSDDTDPRLRLLAVRSLANLYSESDLDLVLYRLLPLLDDEDSNVRATVVDSLADARMGAWANQFIDKLLPLFGDPAVRVRTSAMRALATIGPGGVSSVIAAATLIHARAASDTGLLRAVAHEAIGNDSKNNGAEALLNLLGNAAPPSLPTSHSKANQDLWLLLDNWTGIARSEALRTEAEGRAMEIIYTACRQPADAETAPQWFESTLAWLVNVPFEGPIQRCWTPTERRVIENLLVEFKRDHSPFEKSLSDHLTREHAAPVTRWLTWSVIGWALFWATFLFVFPWSRSVQAVFFWNPKVRGLLSLWFIQILLFAVPLLRRRLLMPFREDLLAAARLDDFQKLGFFPDVRAVIGDGRPMPVTQLLPSLRGTIILRGEAGLGKTSALRWFAVRSTSPIAFLLARECEDGVEAAIGRLIRDVQDDRFVRSLVYSGALTVIVDGLNEVSADTREVIRTFAAEMSKGLMLVGTQPIEWSPPINSTAVDLLPLQRLEAERFLRSRPVGSDSTQKTHDAAYFAAVKFFLHRALDVTSAEDDSGAARLVLSNPFDLNLAADLLAQGMMPSATGLIDEAFRLADEGLPWEPGYRSIVGQSFPLTRFGRHSISMRLEDRNWFKREEFAAELPCLLARKLLVYRAVRSVDGREEQRIQFRHDRVWDFFIASAFVVEPDLWEAYLGDARFRGAYLRIAEAWPIKAASLVRDRLVSTAAHSRDHTTVDEFVRRLEARA